MKIVIAALSLIALNFSIYDAEAEGSDVLKNKIEVIKKSFPNTPSIEDLKLILSSQGEGRDPHLHLDEVDAFVEIQSAVHFASNETGVREDFLMGMLVVESNLGRNVGKCTYAQIEGDAKKAYESGRLGSSSWKTFLRRKRVMEKISSQLEYDLEETMVSCNPAKYVGTGGAMGVAQFMPDTWMEYEKRIAEVVETERPNPWNVRHGVVAMALKLSDVPGVALHNTTAEANAAKLYLSGTTSGRYNWYANKILYWARNYHKLIV